MNLDLADIVNDIVLVRQALVIPPRADRNTRQQRSGVLTEDGALVENSISWNTSVSAVNRAPDTPQPETINDLSGTWMFGGISYGHFGHFILETLSRMWALDELGDMIDGIVFTPKVTSDNCQRVMEVYGPLMRSLGINVRGQVTNVPLRVEKLYVPRQGIGLSDLKLGSRKFRSRVRAVAGKDVSPKGAKRIYISRSALMKDRGGIVGESILEQFLSAEGYEIIHPQKMSAQDQIAQYKAADDIISVDCSPLHLVAYVGHAKQRVGILTRRSMTFAAEMADQIKEFSKADAFEINTLIRDWVPSSASRAGRSSFGEIDFPKTYELLKAKGMIASDTPWPPLSDEQRDADLARIAEVHKKTFHPLDDSSQPSPSPTIPTNS